jgi:hypothetical protein
MAKEQKTALDYFDEMVSTQPGRSCYWCKEWKETVQALVEKKLSRPDMPFIAIWRALRKAGATQQSSSLRRHLIEHEPDLWDRISAE